MIDLMNGAAAMGRRAAEARMVETCTITRPGERVFNEDTGTYIDSTTVLYEGRCELKSRSEDGVHVDSGARDLMRSDPVLKIPANVPHANLTGASVAVVTARGTVRGTIGAEMLGPHRTARRFEMEVLA